jgi:hypothetical protein
VARIKLYLDEDSMRGALAQGLRSRGFDVVTPLDVGRTGLSDVEQLRYAAQTMRAIYTSNQADYARLHWEWMARGQSHYGIIVLSEQAITVGKQVAALSRLAEAWSAESLVDELVYLGAWLRSVH